MKKYISSFGTVAIALVAFLSAASAHAASAPVVSSTLVSVTGGIVTMTGHLDSFSGAALSTYGFEVSGPGFVPATIPATPPGSPFTFTASMPLPCGGIFSFRALATNFYGIGVGSLLTYTEPACPTTPPTVHTVTATVSGMTATLTGHLDSFGINGMGVPATSATVGFNLAGTPVAAGTKTTLTNFSTTTSVACAHTYSFYATATSTGGTAVTDLTPVSFTTPACPSSPVTTTVSATGLTPTSETLVGHVDFGSAPAPADVRFAVWAVPPGTMPVVMPIAGYLSMSGNFTAVATGLLCDTDYTFTAISNFSMPWAGPYLSSLPPGMAFHTLPCPPPALPPTVTTDSVTPLANGATFFGTITSLGGTPSASKRGFSYKTPTGTSTIVTTDPGIYSLGSFGVGSYSLTVSGLLCGTPYHFRAYAVNYAGTGTGVDMGPFNTLPCATPPTVHTVTATVSGGVATLKGHLDSFGISSMGTPSTSANVGFNFGGAPISAGTLSSLSDFTATATVVCGHTYSFFATASTTAGSAVTDLTPVSFTTPACLVPPVPPTVSMTSATYSGVTATLVGTLNTLGTPPSGFPSTSLATTVGFTSLGTPIPAGSVSTNGATFTATYTVTCGTTYTFHATASNTNGSATSTSVLGFTTTACTTTPPSVTMTATLSGLTATVTGILTSFGVPATPMTTTVGLQNGLVPIATTPTMVSSLGATFVSVYPVECDSTYTFHATASNANGSATPASATIITPSCGMTGGTPPVVATDIATSVSSTNAILHGHLSDAGGSVVSTYFNYGTDANYVLTGGGYTTTVAATPSTITTAPPSVPFSYLLAGLSCGTMYHYQAEADSDYGIRDGIDMTFTTSACLLTPPTVTTNAVTTGSITSSSAVINGTENTLGTGGVATLGFTYGILGSSYSTIAPTPTPATAGIPSVPFSTTLSGLSCGTSYKFIATASNGGGSATGLPSATFTTTACPVGAPTVVTDAVGAITSTTAVLNGHVASMGTGATSIISRNFTNSSPTTLSPSTTTVTTMPSAYTTTLTGLTCNTSYNYTMTATNNASVVGTGSPVSFTTAPCSAAITTDSYSSVTQTSATVSGTIVSLGGAPNATSRGFNYGGLSATTSGTYGTGAFSMNLTGLSCNTLYTFTAKATTTSGTFLAPSSLTFTTLPCNPAVTTVSAAMTSISTALFTGTLTATGGTGVLNHIGFEYGPTTSYGMSINATSPGATTTSPAPVTFTATATGLPTMLVTGSISTSAILCNAPWHMRAWAWNDGNPTAPVTGADMTFCKPGAGI